MIVSCCALNPIPDIIRVTVTAETGTCGITDFFLFLVSGTVASWEGADNNGNLWRLNCLNLGVSCLDFQLDGAFYAFQHKPNAGCSCDPLFLEFSGNLNALPFCLGTITLVITT